MFQRLAIAALIAITVLPSAAAERHSLMRERVMEPSLPGLSPAMATPRGPTSYTWFWEEVSPAIAAAGPGRWQRALRVIERGRAQGRGIAFPEQRVARIVKRWGGILKREAEKRRVSLPLLIAIVAVESGGNAGAISPKGAGGLMQLMPQTAKRFGVSNSLAPAQNVRGGARYFSWLLKEFNEDPVLALAGYNAGERAVMTHGGVPPYRETRDYVPKVAAAYLVARRYCQDPVQGARDICKLS
ncbi:MAG: lytic transglycosylase domain-containing protein [Pseudomonadota bacterium]